MFLATNIWQNAICHLDKRLFGLNTPHIITIICYMCVRLFCNLFFVWQERKIIATLTNTSLHQQTIANFFERLHFHLLFLFLFYIPIILRKKLFLAKTNQMKNTPKPDVQSVPAIVNLLPRHVALVLSSSQFMPMTQPAPKKCCLSKKWLCFKGCGLLQT